MLALTLGDDNSLMDISHILAILSKLLPSTVEESVLHRFAKTLTEDVLQLVKALSKVTSLALRRVFKCKHLLTGSMK